MPYIPPEQRELLDPGIAVIADDILARMKQDEPWIRPLYVAICGLAKSCLPELRYRSLCRMTGVLENVKQEFCRRLDLSYDCSARLGWRTDTLCPPIESLVEAIKDVAGDGDWEGLLNYSISSLILAVIPAREWPCSEAVVELLEAAKQDFYKTIAGPYEDTAIAKNGDIY